MKKWLGEKLRTYLSRRRQCRELLAMDERMQKDLALSRVDAEQLAGVYKPMQEDGNEWMGRGCNHRKPPIED